MGLFSKFLAGGLGWVLGGPIGAIIGVILASAFDSNSQK
jgi:DnaJ like chaperone protein